MMCALQRDMAPQLAQSKGLSVTLGRWKLMYCHAPFPPKPKWRVWRDKVEKHIYVDLGRVRIFRKGNGVRPLPLERLPCPSTKTHDGHLWNDYDIDQGKHRTVFCTGNFLTVE